jgi:hypothetical protein
MKQRSISFEKNNGLVKKRKRAIVETPITKANTTTILGSISPFGIINVNVRRPYEAPSRKRKLPDASIAFISKEIKTIIIVTDYYFNFVISDMHEQFKMFYATMDNAPIHKHGDIGRYVISVGCALNGMTM